MSICLCSSSCLSFHICLFSSINLSIPYVYTFIYLSNHFIYQSMSYIYIFNYLSISLCIYSSIYLIHLFIRSSINLIIYLFIYISLSESMHHISVKRSMQKLPRNEAFAIRDGWYLYAHRRSALSQFPIMYISPSSYLNIYY